MIMKPVVGYEKYFSVTEDGKVYSHRTNKFLKLHINRKGYCIFSTKINGRDGKAICFKVHRVVAEAFLLNPENKSEVNHIDGNKLNNNVINLEWVSRSENIQHAFRIGLMHSNGKSGYDNYNHKLSKEAVEFIRNNKNRYTIRELGKMFNVHHCTISRCMLNKRYK